MVLLRRWSRFAERVGDWESMLLTGSIAMFDYDTRYYRERAVTERAMARASERQEIRAIHEELARQYDALVEQAELRLTQCIHLTPAAARPTAS